MIEFRLLGALQLTDAEGREVTSLLTRPRRLALLAYLAAATPRGLHRRDTLLALFWPELDQEHARAALRQALHIVRGALGPDVLITRGDDEIGLDVDRLACDVVAFDRAVAAGRFAEAVDAYSGPLLAGFFIPGAGEFEGWLERERARLQRAASSSARALVEQYEAAGDLHGALEWARRAARLAPHEEDPLRHLVTLLDRLGDRAGAVDAYDEFAKRLAGDLETEPAAETQALLAAVRARATVGPVESPSRPRAGVAPATPAPGVAAPPAPRRAALWPRLSGTGVLGLLLAASAGGWPGRPAPRRGPIRAVAVLPLESLSGDSLQGWFADGMTEALITDLGRISALRVSSRSAVMQARGTARPLGTVVRDLQVDAVVEGGVQRAGDSVRVDLRLIDGPSGYQLWAGRIAASVRDRFAIEDSVARSVAGALGVSLTPAEQRALRTAPTGNQQADELYLRAKVRIRHETRADDSVAIALLERAVALDPGFAVAHAALAHAYAMRVKQFAPDDSAARERAFVSVERALRLNPDLAEAHSVTAGLMWDLTKQFAPERAIEEDRRALALNPNLSDAHHHLGTIYLHIGLLDKAVAEFQRALALNPFDANAQRRIGIAQIYRGQYADGYATFRRVGPEGNPALWTYQTAWALLYLGRDSAAGALIEDYLRAHPEDRGGVVRSTRAILRAKRGDAAGAAEDIRRAVNAGVGFIHFHHSAYNIASVYAILGHPGPAVHWLRRAADEGWPCYPYFANDPNLANIRDDPGFRSFMRELQAQWERYRATL